MKNLSILTPHSTDIFIHASLILDWELKPIKESFNGSMKMCLDKLFAR